MQIYLVFLSQENHESRPAPQLWYPQDSNNFHVSQVPDVNVQLDKKSDVESCTYLSQRKDAVIASEWVDVERVIVSIDVLGELPRQLGVLVVPAVIGLKEGRIVDKLVAPSPSNRYENQIMEYYEIHLSSNKFFISSIYKKMFDIFHQMGVEG